MPSAVLALQCLWWHLQYFQTMPCVSPAPPSLNDLAGALAQGAARLRDASAVLEGPQGLGSWSVLHGSLVARRNRLVAELGHAFQVRPALQRA
jgi:hypothetical protein